MNKELFKYTFLRQMEQGDSPLRMLMCESPHVPRKFNNRYKEKEFFTCSEFGLDISVATLTAEDDSFTFDVLFTEDDNYEMGVNNRSADNDLSRMGVVPRNYCHEMIMFGRDVITFELYHHLITTKDHIFYSTHDSPPVYALEFNLLTMEFTVLDHGRPFANPSKVLSIWDSVRNAKGVYAGFTYVDWVPNKSIFERLVRALYKSNVNNANKEFIIKSFEVARLSPTESTMSQVVRRLMSKSNDA
jgi:hypothetical protein